MTEYALPAPEYAPGVCNIGTTEASNRRKIGHGGAVATVVLAVLLLALDLHPAFLLLTALPAFVMTTGYIQARSRFCAGYGASGLSNFGDSLGASAQAADPAARAADRSRAKQITVYSVIVGVLVGAALVAIASLF